MNNPLVSVIIVTWNRKDDMVETLESLQKQTYHKQKRKNTVFVNNKFPEGEKLEICVFVRKEADFNGPRPWEGLPDFKIEVSDLKNKHV